MSDTTLPKKSIFKPPPPVSVNSTPKVQSTSTTTTSSVTGPVVMGAVVVNQGTTPLKHGVVAPRVGGVLELETDKFQGFHWRRW